MPAHKRWIRFILECQEQGHWVAEFGNYLVLFTAAAGNCGGRQVQGLTAHMTSTSQGPWSAKTNQLLQPVQKLMFCFWNIFVESILFWNTNPKCFLFLRDSLLLNSILWYNFFLLFMQPFKLKAISYPSRKKVFPMSSHFSFSHFQSFFIPGSKKGVWSKLRSRKQLGKMLLIFFGTK